MGMFNIGHLPHLELCLNEGLHCFCHAWWCIQPRLIQLGWGGHYKQDSMSVLPAQAHSCPHLYPQKEAESQHHSPCTVWWSNTLSSWEEEQGYCERQGWPASPSCHKTSTSTPNHWVIHDSRQDHTCVLHDANLETGTVSFACSITLAAQCHICHFAHSWGFWPAHVCTNLRFRSAILKSLLSPI